MAGLPQMRAARTPTAARQPIDVEQLLVWTYRDQRADVVIRRGAGLHTLEALADGVEVTTTSACGCASVARIAELGVRVDSSGRDAGALHPDAEVIHLAVMQLTEKLAGLPLWRLVIHHASMNERPDPMVGVVPRPRPYRHPVNGEVRIEGKDRNGRYGYCPISYQPSDASIRAAREEYAAWHACLVWLVETLRIDPRLTRWHPMPPAAPAEPWNHA